MTIIILTVIPKQTNATQVRMLIADLIIGKKYDEIFPETITLIFLIPTSYELKVIHTNADVV